MKPNKAPFDSSSDMVAVLKNKKDIIANSSAVIPQAYSVYKR
jgi:hypothetical protein